MSSKVDMVADMLVDELADMLANMEVDKVADMGADMKVADIVATWWLTRRWTWWPTLWLHGG